MLHSGSRGVGNRIGTFFIELAKNDMRQHIKNLPDKDLAYFPEGTRTFRRLFRSGELGAGIRAVQSQADDGAVGRRRAATRVRLPPFSLTENSGQLPSQLRRARATLRRTWSSSRARAQCARAKAISALFPAAWERARTSCAGSAIRRAFRAAVTAPAAPCRAAKRSGDFRSRIMQSDGRRRMPQRRRRDRRNADGLQADRRCHERAEGSGRDRAHSSAGGLCEGIR